MRVRFAEPDAPVEPAALPFWLMLGLVIAVGSSLGAAAALVGMILRP
jgi:hypothetical protein